MSESVNFTNVYCTYIKNEPHIYPGEDTEIINVSNTQDRKSHTGWQIIPNMMWHHYVTPKQWAEFTIKYQSYHVESAKATVFNPVPITNTPAIQRTNIFAAFNNCTYCWGYQDDLYETYWHPWIWVNDVEKINLFFKEGIYWPTGSGSTSAQTGMVRFVLPPYYWKRPNARTAPDSRVWGQGDEGEGVYPGYYTDMTNNPTPGAIEWDPLNRPDKIMELRAGKNAIDFEWHCHESDKNKWVNIDRLIHWTPWTPDGPYQTGGRPFSLRLFAQNDPDQLSTYGLSLKHGSTSDGGTASDRWFWDYTIPNWANMPIVPMAWWWKEMRESIILNSWPGNQFPDLCAPGTEYEQYHYGPTQWFLKGIPLLGEDNTLIKTSTQVAIKITLTLKAKRRESAIYCPTWGPFAWKQLYSHTKGNRIFQESLVRYRTGGARRTWQNRQSDIPETTDGIKKHPRVPPYGSNTYPNTQRPLGILEEETEELQNDKEELRVTFTREGERVRIQMPERPVRRKTPIRDPSTSKPIETQLMETLNMG